MESRLIMNFLLIGGQPDTGKTEAIHRIVNNLIGQRYRIITGVLPLPPDDFTILLQKNDGLKILIHSATDDNHWIDNLESSINKHNPNFVITSIRDIDWQRDRVLRIVGSSFFAEFPLARITRRNNSFTGKMRFTDALDWYRNSIDNNVIFILSNPPFNLL